MTLGKREMIFPVLALVARSQSFGSISEEKIPQRTANNPNVGSGLVDFFHNPENIARDKGESDLADGTGIGENNPSRSCMLPDLQKGLIFSSMANIIDECDLAQGH